MRKKYYFILLIAISFCFFFLGGCDTGITIEDVNEVMQAMYKEAEPVITEISMEDDNDAAIDESYANGTLNVTGSRIVEDLGDNIVSLDLDLDITLDECENEETGYTISGTISYIGTVVLDKSDFFPVVVEGSSFDMTGSLTLEGGQIEDAELDFSCNLVQETLTGKIIVNGVEYDASDVDLFGGS